MGIFRRKTTWQRLVGTMAPVAGSPGVRRAAKATLGVVGGAVTATAMSAAVSSARRRDQR
jgi:hypothetical protein